MCSTAIETTEALEVHINYETSEAIREKGIILSTVLDETVVDDMMHTVATLLAKHIEPRIAEIEITREFPKDIYAAMGDAGLFGAWVPEAYGGLGVSLGTSLQIVERLARTHGASALIFANCGDAVGPIVLGGSEEIKNTYLPQIAAGTIVPAFALTEPGAGSDAAGIESSAKRDGDNYVLTGSKIFCTNGSVAGVFVVFAKTGPGTKDVSAFVVPRDSSGLEIGSDERMLGLHGCPATAISLQGVVVPKTSRLGNEGDGLRLALSSLDESRLNASAMATGVARGALEIAVSYAKEREQFGQPIIKHQGLGFLLAEMATQMYTSWAVLSRAIAALESERSKATSAQAAMAKLYCTDTAMDVATKAVQVLGGYGLSVDFQVERMMRDVKAFQIFDGTSQIQKLIIARHLNSSEIPLPERW